jgi:hypothetical protein
MFDANSHLCNPLVFGFGRWRQVIAAWLFMRLLDVHIGHRKPLKAQILIEDAVRWQGIPFIIRKAFVVPAPFIRRTEEPDAAIGGNQDEVFERVALFLSAVVEGLLMRIARAIDRAFGAIVEKRDGASALANAAVCASLSRCAAERWGR